MPTSTSKLAWIAHLLWQTEQWDQAAGKAAQLARHVPSDADLVRIVLDAPGAGRFELPFPRERLVAIIGEGRDNLRQWAARLRKELHNA